MIRFRLASGLAIGCAMALLAGCANEPVAKKEPEPPPEPVTGQTALFRMYQVARSSWARDVMVQRMTSMRINGVPEAPPGKANAWEAIFNSPSLGSSRSYTYSIVEQLPDLHKDVFGGPQQTPSGTPFLIAAVKVDSDAAYHTAVAKLGKEAEARNADKPVLILLEMDRRLPDPAWRIVWGESVATAAVSVLIDANTGEYLNTLH